MRISKLEIAIETRGVIVILGGSERMRSGLGRVKPTPQASL